MLPEIFLIGNAFCNGILGFSFLRKTDYRGKIAGLDRFKTLSIIFK